MAVITTVMKTVQMAARMAMVSCSPGMAVRKADKMAEMMAV